MTTTNQTKLIITHPFNTREHVITASTTTTNTPHPPVPPRRSTGHDPFGAEGRVLHTGAVRLPEGGVHMVDWHEECHEIRTRVAHHLPTLVLHIDHVPHIISLVIFVIKQ